MTEGETYSTKGPSPMGVEPEDGELGAIGQAELVQYRADAIADRAFAQEQSGGDVAVIEALGDQRGDLTLTLAKQAFDGIGGISGIVGIGRSGVRSVSLPSTSAPSTT